MFDRLADTDAMLEEGCCCELAFDEWLSLCSLDQIY
jgi:hypothetical protein